MRHLLLALLLLCFSASFALAASGHVSVKNGQVFVERDGKTTPVSKDTMTPDAVGNSTLLYVTVGEEDAKPLGLKGGLYIFDAEGKAAGFAPSEAAEFCGQVSMAPGGTVLAMDSGTWLIRSWSFFSYPDMKPMGEVEYYQVDEITPIFWKGDTEALFTTMETETERACDYDPCGPTSIKRHDLASGKTSIILAGTTLCDYVMFSLDGDTITAGKRCLPNAEAWKNFPGAPTEKMTVKLP